MFYNSNRPQIIAVKVTKFNANDRFIWRFNKIRIARAPSQLQTCAREDHSMFEQRKRYVRENPVRAGFVALPEQWLYMLKDSCNALIALIISQYLEKLETTDKLSRLEIITKGFKALLERNFTQQNARHIRTAVKHFRCPSERVRQKHDRSIPFQSIFNSVLFSKAKPINRLWSSDNRLTKRKNCKLAEHKRLTKSPTSNNGNRCAKKIEFKFKAPNESRGFICLDK